MTSTSGDTPNAPVRRTGILQELLRKRKLQFTGIFLLALISNAAGLVLPWIVGELLTAIQSGHGSGRWTWTMVAIGLGSAVTGALGTYLLSRMGHQMIGALRIRSMSHSLRLKLRAARGEGTGNLAARLTSDAAAVKGIVDIGPIQLPMAAITLTGTVVIMAILDWVLLLITVGAFLTALLIIAMVMISLQRRYRAIHHEIGALTEHFVAAMESLPAIKAYRAEPIVTAGLSTRARQVAGIEGRASLLESLMVPVINLGQQIALVSVILGGSARMLAGHLTLNAFVAFLLYLFQLTAPLIMAISGMSTIQAGLAARDRFDRLFALPAEDISEAPEDVETRGDAPAVRFNRVSFGYGDLPVLREAVLTVPARGLTAMVGPSGAGKTTVMGLIERFLEADCGQVEVFGRDVADWPLGALRARMSYLDQNATLLRDTIRANLTLGHETPPSDQELMSALERVGLAEEILLLPHGLDTVLGGADDLSGGQRQRLALARVVLSDAPLVLLDEPSSQLDSLNEERLRTVINDIAEDRAVLVVAHRISTVRHAQQVIVMSEGGPVAQGRHDELLRTCPEYAALVNGQMLHLDHPADHPERELVGRPES